VAILVSLFIAAFALDALSEGVIPFLLHLSPALLLLLVVAASWRWPWIGGSVFLGLAILYAVTVGRRPAWVAVISGPLAAAGVLFIWSWLDRSNHRR
jgi:hypothetical protein